MNEKPTKKRQGKPNNLLTLNEYSLTLFGAKLVKKDNIIFYSKRADIIKNTENKKK